MSERTDHLPSCWDDDIRMSALFAPPRSQTTNPQDWQGKYKFWSEAVLNWAVSSETLIFELSDLKKVFWRKGVIPACLEQVVQQMERDGKIVPADSYRQDASTTWTSWGYRTVRTTITWSWNKFRESLFHVEKELPKYTIPSVVEKLSQRILQTPEAENGETVEIQELTANHENIFRSAEDTELLLRHLHVSGKAVVDTELERPMIKFLSKVRVASPINSPAKVEKPRITLSDKGLAMLKHTEKLLVSELEVLRKNAVELEEKARREIKLGNRNAAKAALHQRKLIEKLEEKRMLALTNIQTMELQLKQAQTDSKVMEAYQVGLAALKDSLKGLPSGPEKVEDTLIELESVLEQHEEIQAALSATVGEQDFDESELNEELDELLRAERAEAPVPEEVRETLEEILPSPPTFSPETLKAKKQIDKQKEKA